MLPRMENNLKDISAVEPPEDPDELGSSGRGRQPFTTNEVQNKMNSAKHFADLNSGGVKSL